MGSLSSTNKNIKYLLCVIDVFTKYAWLKPLKEKKSLRVPNAFIKIVNIINPKLNKFWVNQGKEFCNKFMEKWLDNNDILSSSPHKESKSVITESFILIWLMKLKQI